jgi:hypothetical protein
LTETERPLTGPKDTVKLVGPVAPSAKGTSLMVMLGSGSSSLIVPTPTDLLNVAPDTALNSTL